MEIDTFIIDAFEGWLAAGLTPAAVRAIEAGEKADFSWDSILESGFADLLVPEEQGGAGSNLATAGKLVHLCGRQALPLPLAFTVFARGAIARTGLEIPSGAITFAKAVIAEDGSLLCRDVAFGSVSDWVIAVTADGKGALLSCAEANRTANGLQADIEWAGAGNSAQLRDWPVDLQAIAAAVLSGLMAGAADRVLEMSLAYAGDRKQFGKPLAAFQAIQQNLSLLAEEAFAVRIAAEQAFARPEIDLLSSAVAKARASKAAPAINAIGHLVHGAIGITAEFDLQLCTRRLAEWRLCFGGERLWCELIGQRLLASRQNVLPFLVSIAEGNQPEAA